MIKVYIRTVVDSIVLEDESGDTIKVPKSTVEAAMRGNATDRLRSRVGASLGEEVVIKDRR